MEIGKEAMEDTMIGIVKIKLTKENLEVTVRSSPGKSRIRSSPGKSRIRKPVNVFVNRALAGRILVISRRRLKGLKVTNNDALEKIVLLPFCLFFSSIACS